jgi:hypothetical protein
MNFDLMMEEKFGRRYLIQQIVKDLLMNHFVMNFD